MYSGSERPREAEDSAIQAEEAKRPTTVVKCSVLLAGYIRLYHMSLGSRMKILKGP
jgi:hypothetical protein